jgi:hypothetical protein
MVSWKLLLRTVHKRRRCGAPAQDTFTARLAQRRDLERARLRMEAAMSRARSITLLVAAASCAAVVGGCRENEQNRPLEFRPHVYQGEKPPSLSEQQRRDLQERGNLQR